MDAFELIVLILTFAVGAIVSGSIFFQVGKLTERRKVADSTSPLLVTMAPRIKTETVVTLHGANGRTPMRVVNGYDPPKDAA